MRIRSVVLFGLMGLVLPLGCSDDSSGNGQNGDAGLDGSGACEEGTLQCDMARSVVLQCQDGKWVDKEVCEGDTPYCHEDHCVKCLPNAKYCEGNDVMQCNEDGTDSTLVESCGLGTTCTAGACSSACELASQKHSYIGCEYWPASVANAQLDPAFDEDFAVVVHNANDTPATVTITKGTMQVAEEEIGAGELKVIRLSYDETLKGDKDNFQSVLAPNGAYHLESTMPVTVYQFNPLDFELQSQCQNSSEQPCHSYSNDASLLLPSHVLSNNYVVVSLPTLGISKTSTQNPPPYHFIPGFVSIVATQDDTTVTIHFSAYTEPGDGIQSYRPGDTAQFSLAKGQVLQVLSAIPSDCSEGTESQDDCNGQSGYTCKYCNMGPEYDLTGTVIESTAPVAVFSGHVCAFVPYNYWACDHLEEQMFPSEAWGSDYIVGRTEPQGPEDPEPNVVKIVSREDDNDITFDPPDVHEDVTLASGEYLEFSTGTNFRVTGTKPFMVAHFLVGQNYYTNQKDYWGDPAFALVVPFEQYRQTYTFLTPETFTYNYVNIIGPVSEDGLNIYNIKLDGELVTFPPEKIGHYSVARIDISDTVESFHTVTGDQPFGVMVYGFAKFTSYYYPGGLDLRYINPVE